MDDGEIRAYYDYGKKYYTGQLKLTKAVKDIMLEHPDIQDRSARHYISLYKIMREGKVRDWYSDPRLLKYYLEHITLDEGVGAGAMACKSILGLALHGRKGKYPNKDKLIEDVKDIASKYGIQFSTASDNAHLTPSAALQHIQSYIAQKGFSYEKGLIENFYLCLKAKPFVILAGTSGTGKTRLVRLFAEAAGATAANGRYRQAAVRPDWSDPSDLFGHVDLNGNFVPGAVTDFLEKAAKDLDHPYFLCLDEMNLARVEYYLSDYLSAVETRELKDGCIVADPIRVEGHGDLILPENLYVVGTVNMDETTFPFSRKVLDRANAIEFSFVDLMPPEEDGETETAEPLELDNGFFRSEWLTLRQCMGGEEEESVRKWCGVLCQCNEILKKADAQVGYRVRDEIVFYLLYSRKTDLMEEKEAMDREILQKILPRIQGSSGAVRDMIGELFQFCAGDYEGLRTDSGEINRKMARLLEEDGNRVRFPRSAAKLASMMRRYEEDGFTSYWQ